MLTRVSAKLPTRKVMVEKFLAGKLPRLDQFAIEKDPAWYEKVQDSMRIQKYFEKEKPAEVKLANTPELLDTLWGFYFATGTYASIARIAALLPWSKDRDSVDRLTVGSMAKYTLVNNASRDPKLLNMVKYAAKHEPAEVRPVLKEVIDAAETVDTTRVRKEALAAIEELQRKGSGSKRDMAWWGYLGEGRDCRRLRRRRGDRGGGARPALRRRRRDHLLCAADVFEPAVGRGEAGSSLLCPLPLRERVSQNIGDK